MLHLVTDLAFFRRCHGFIAGAEQIIIKRQVFKPHFGMENILLVCIHVDHFVSLFGVTRQEILD